MLSERSVPSVVVIPDWGRMPRRMAARSVFAWRTSTSPLLARARLVCEDTRLRNAGYVCSVGGGPGGIGYAGVADGFSHVLPFLEQRDAHHGDGHRETGTVSWRDLAAGWAPDGVDLMAVGAPARRLRPLTAPHTVLLPFRVELVVPVVPDAAAMRARVSRKERQHVARQRRDRDWSLEHATAAADFDHFYDHMHLPTMRRRHGDATRSLERDIAFECAFRHGLLFFLTERGTRVAGMLCRWTARTRTLTLRLAGVSEGADEHYRSGAFTALYPLILEWAAQHGVRAVNLSGCEPFLSKGIFQFKRKLHPRVVLPASHFGGKRLLLRVVRDSARVRDFLVANPVIAEIPGGGLEAVYFHDERRPARLDHRWEGVGLRAARQVHLDSFLSNANR